MFGHQGRCGDDIIVPKKDEGAFCFPYPIVARGRQPFIFLGNASNNDRRYLAEVCHRRRRPIRRTVVDDKNFQDVGFSSLVFIAMECLEKDFLAVVSRNDYAQFGYQQTASPAVGDFLVTTTIIL